MGNRVIYGDTELLKLISYMAMGDGGVYRNGPLNCRFTMCMLATHGDYLKTCTDILSNVTPVHWRLIDKVVYGKQYSPQIEITSGNHTFFTDLRKRIYVGSYKGLDYEALEWLDYESLSFLYQSDGSCCYEKKPNRYKVTLGCCRLTHEDLSILSKALLGKLGLLWYIHKHGKYYQLCLKTEHIPIFMENIAPFIEVSFKYKIIEPYRTVSPENQVMI